GGEGAAELIGGFGGRAGHGAVADAAEPGFIDGLGRRRNGVRYGEFLRLSRLQAGRFLLARPLFAVPTGEAARLQGAGKTFGQTRSGTRNTHALGQVLPRIRTLDGCLYCCPQARLRTLPGSMGNRGKKGLEIQMRRQKRGVQVTLYWPNATGALVPPFSERLLDV